MLTNSDINELVAFRRHLHRRPELSGEEEWTAAEIAGALDRLIPDDLMTGLGGHGVAGKRYPSAPCSSSMNVRTLSGR